MLVEDEARKDRQISILDEQIRSLIIYLGIACIIAVVLAIFLYSSYAAVARRDHMLRTCVGDISTLNDSINSMNDVLDSISTDASNASGDDYDSQSSALYDISNSADSARTTDQSSSCSQISDENSYDSGN